MKMISSKRDIKSELILKQPFLDDLENKAGANRNG
jgi:hypothetical protein